MLMMLGALADSGRTAPEQLEQLLLDIAAGDQDSLSEFYEKTRAAVYGLALSYLKNGHDAEDVTQDTYVRVWDMAPAYRPQGKPMGWVLTIAKNFALMRLRRQSREQDLPQEEWESFAVDSPAVTAEDRELARRCAGRPALALVNKEDKPARFDAGEVADCFELLLPVCCKEPEAREQIAAAVEKLLGTNRLDPHAASLSGQRQLAAAVRARDAVQGALEAVDTGFGLDAVSVCVDDALDALCTLTGENASEAVIDQVFERFCVGK